MSTRPSMPTVHNAWSDPVAYPTANAGITRRSSGQGAGLHPGTNLYPGAYGYVPTGSAGGQTRQLPGENRGGRGYHRRYYYNNFPYPVYYPSFYGDYGGVGYDGAVGNYAGITTDDQDLGAPDFSVAPSNYAYIAPSQDAGHSDAPVTPTKPLPDAPAVGPESPATAAPSSQASQGPDSLVEAVQEELGKRGYFAGKPDAVYSASTREAIRRFQTDQQLPATGRINEATLRALHLD